MKRIIKFSHNIKLVNEGCNNKVIDTVNNGVLEQFIDTFENAIQFVQETYGAYIR